MVLPGIFTFNLQLSIKDPDPVGTVNPPAFTLFHGFPQFFRIPPLLQTLPLAQLELHCVK
jgi:hypothetical protein